MLLNSTKCRFKKRSSSLRPNIFCCSNKKARILENNYEKLSEDELVANLFRINQTKQKLVKDKISSENNANNTHYEVDKKVRKAIKDIGGTFKRRFAST